MFGSILAQRQSNALRATLAVGELLGQPHDVVDVRNHPFDLVFGADRNGLQQMIDHREDSACGRVFDGWGNHLRELCADRGHQLGHRGSRHHDSAPTPTSSTELRCGACVRCASVILSHSLQARDHGDMRYAESSNALSPLTNRVVLSNTGPKARQPLRMTKY